MEQNRRKTQKIMNLECGSIWFEVIMKITKENKPILVIYKKYYLDHVEAPNQMESYSWKTISRSKVHECQYLVEALDWISTYIKTGQHRKKG